ncbi:hypothetical protein QYE76_068954 [Lolium multiflorum]|uniref:Uncharacterized protein n=1 Tax=Lolium multiflorum TaxID=4521 RepID=A0AAD8SFU1_LOLMU|nr:hypothetical protein QYE76_068954 [Lolium multiflorum]
MLLLQFRRRRCHQVHQPSRRLDSFDVTKRDEKSDDTFIEPPPKKARSDAVSRPLQLPKLRLPRRLLWRKHRLPPLFPKGKMLLLLLQLLLLIYEIRLQEEARSSSSKLDGAIKKAVVARQEVDSLKEELNKLKERLKKKLGRQKRMNSSVNLLWPCLVFPVPSFVDDSSGVLPESDRIQRMRDRIAQMEKDLRSTYALAAIINKKSQTAADVERYALTELHKATESLNCLLSIANVLEALYPKVLLPANIIVDRLEKDSKVPEVKETPQG